MTTLYVSHMKEDTDNLGRVITTLTQEIVVKLNQTEEDCFLTVLKYLNEEDECIQWHTDNWEVLEVYGDAVNRAIDTTNKMTNHVLIAPITKIEDDEIYKIEFEY